MDSSDSPEGELPSVEQCRESEPDRSVADQAAEGHESPPQKPGRFGEGYSGEQYLNDLAHRVSLGGDPIPCAVWEVTDSERLGEGIKRRFARIGEWRRDGTENSA